MTRTLVLWAALVVLTLLLCPSDAGALELEGGTIAALNSELDIGLTLSVGEVLPEWLGDRIVFLDFIAVNTEPAIGVSVSTRPADQDDGWRIGATITTPNEGPREVLGYLRYGVAIKF